MADQGIARSLPVGPTRRQRQDAAAELAAKIEQVEVKPEPETPAPFVPATDDQIAEYHERMIGDAVAKYGILGTMFGSVVVEEVTGAKENEVKDEGKITGYTMVVGRVYGFTHVTGVKLGPWNVKAERDANSAADAKRRIKVTFPGASGTLWAGAFTDLGDRANGSEREAWKAAVEDLYFAHVERRKASGAPALVRNQPVKRAAREVSLADLS